MPRISDWEPAAHTPCFRALHACGAVHVTSGPSTSTLHTYAAEDFPRLPDLDTVGTFTVDRESLLDTVSRVARSASRDESRPTLTGILVRLRRQSRTQPSSAELVSLVANRRAAAPACLAQQ
jgi:DNA polymerase III sliding clamp (beta) subunit (PCNA family)